MKTLKRLTAVLALTFVLSLSAVAGETITPPCDPGETHGLPCASAQQSTGDSTGPGETHCPPASIVEIVVTDAALDIVQSALSIF